MDGWDKVLFLGDVCGNTYGKDICNLFSGGSGEKVFLKVYIISREKCGKMLIFGELGE